MFKEWIDSHGWRSLQYDATLNPRPRFREEGLVGYDPGNGRIAISAIGQPRESLIILYKADPFEGAERFAEILEFIASQHRAPPPSPPATKLEPDEQMMVVDNSTAQKV
jgi:hypothetical protein